MPVPSTPQDLITLIREKLYDNTSGIIEEDTLRNVLENIINVLDAKFSFFSPTLTEEQYSQWNLMLDYMMRETKGVLTTSSTAPTGTTAKGKYLLSDVGTYTNLGGLVTTASKLNYAYFDGSTWSLIAVDMPNFVAPIDNLESTSTTAPLASNQGRILNQRIHFNNSNLIKDYNLYSTVNSQGYYENGKFSDDEIMFSTNSPTRIRKDNLFSLDIINAPITSRLFISKDSLIKKQIKNGDYVLFGLKIKVDATNGNDIFVFAGDDSVFATKKIVNTDWIFISVKKQITFDSETFKLITFGIDNTHNSGAEIASFKELTLIKCEQDSDLLTDSIIPNLDETNIGKNLIFDKDFELSERYTRFLDFNSEGTTSKKSFSTVDFNGKTIPCIKIENETTSPISFSQSFEILNNFQQKYFQKGFRIKITALEATSDKYAFCTFFNKGAYDSFAPESFKIEIGKWVDCVSPTYLVYDKLNWSYRINVPIGKWKVEIIEPCLITKQDNSSLFHFTDSSNLGLDFLNKKFTFLGDSLTDGGTWQKLVQDKLGCKIYIRGVGSSKVARTLFPTWINPNTQEHITNINYNAYPPQLNIAELNNYNANCKNFKGIFAFENDRNRLITSPVLGDYIWWSNGQATPIYKRQYFDGTNWITESETVNDTNENVLYKTINGMITSIDRANTLPTNTDYLFFMGGTNDWDTSVGSITDFGGDTFIGRVRECLQWLSIRCPNAKIFLMTSPKMSPEYNFNSHLITGDGNIRDNYREAIRNIGKTYGYSIIEMQNTMSFYQLQSFTNDGVHPNSKGDVLYFNNFCKNL